MRICVPLGALLEGSIEVLAGAGLDVAPLRDAGRRLVVEAEGGHYTLVTVSTDQPGESELDKLSKRFLGEVHVLAEPAHRLRGAY